MKALVGAFNQEKALVGAFSVIVRPVVEPMDRFAALVTTATAKHLVGVGAAREQKGGREAAGSRKQSYMCQPSSGGSC